MGPMVTLETARLLLRPFSGADVDAYAEMCADTEVMRFLGGRLWSRAETWRHIATILGHWHLLGYGMWAVEERSSGRFVGRVGFIDPPGWPGFELGWALARPFWGHGLAAEAGRAALEYAFSELDKEHVISLIHPENRRSLRLAERLGQCFERATEHFEETVSVYGIRRREWMSGK